METLETVKNEQSAKTVQILVNKQPVEITLRDPTGLEIKQAAIEQGVKIQENFILSQLLGNSGETKIIGDADTVHLNKHSEFVAVAPDDNSDESHDFTPAISQALNEIRATFKGHSIQAQSDSNGGAFVEIQDVCIGSKHLPNNSWLGCHLTFQYPFADVYPIFLAPNIQRTDGKSHGQGVGQGQFQGRPATQLSRRSNKRDPKLETAAIKILKVLKWFQES